jgi:hypothetical protein
MRQCRWRLIQMLTNLAHVQPFFARAHQQTKDRKARVMAKGS